MGATTALVLRDQPKNPKVNAAEWKRLIALYKQVTQHDNWYTAKIAKYVGYQTSTGIYSFLNGVSLMDATKKERLEQLADLLSKGKSPRLNYGRGRSSTRRKHVRKTRRINKQTEFPDIVTAHANGTTNHNSNFGALRAEIAERIVELQGAMKNLDRIESLLTATE